MIGYIYKLDGIRCFKNAKVAAQNMKINYRTANNYFSQATTPPIAMMGIGFGRSKVEAVQNIYQQKFNQTTEVLLTVKGREYRSKNFTQAAKVLETCGIKCSRKDVQRACAGSRVKKLSGIQIRRITSRQD